MAAAALLVVVAAVVVAAKAGHHSARPTTVQPAQLGGLLLSANDIGAVMGAPGIVIDYASDGLTPLADSISDDKCRGTLHGLQPPVYEGSGYTAVNAQTLRDPSGTSWVQQAVVGYPWAAVARKFLKQSTTDWKSCAGQSVTLTGQGANAALGRRRRHRRRRSDHPGKLQRGRQGVGLSARAESRIERNHRRDRMQFRRDEPGGRHRRHNRCADRPLTASEHPRGKDAAT